MSTRSLLISDIPAWLRNSDVVEDMYYTSKKLSFSKCYHATYFKETDEVKSMEDFFLVLNVCYEFKNELPESLLKYASKNCDKIRENIKKLLPNSFRAFSFSDELIDVLDLDEGEIDEYENLKREISQKSDWGFSENLLKSLVD